MRWHRRLLISLFIMNVAWQCSADMLPHSLCRGGLSILCHGCSSRCWWWNSYVLGVWGEEQWHEQLQMSRATVENFVSSLRSRLQRQSTRMRQPIPLEEHVAIVVWWLPNTISYRVLAQLFGVARSTVAGIVIDVCLAIEAELLSSVVCPGPVLQVSILLNQYPCIMCSRVPLS